MASPEVITLFSIIFGVMVAGFGGIGNILIKLNKTIGRIEVLIENHEKRIKKLERKNR